MKKILLLAGVSVVSTLLSAQVTVNIDKSIQLQKIEGFGAYGLNRTAWDQAPFYNNTFVKDMVEDLGMTISRAESYPMEATNDNSNPKVSDMSKFSPSAFNRAYWSFAKEAQALANTYGDTIKFFYSVWTPPAWMKYTNTENGTDVTWNRLVANDFTPPGWTTFVAANVPGRTDDCKEEFTEHCWVSAQMFKQNAGFDLYAYSLQNELAFGQTFNSCVYSPEQYRELLKVAGKRFREEGSKIKFMMHEDIGDLGRFSQFMNAVTRDKDAVQYQDIGACHAYNASGTLAGSTSASTWDGMFRVTNRAKPTQFWQTETSGYGQGWDGGLSLAKAMYVGLKFGKVSAWVWWQAGERMSDRSESQYALISDDVKSKRYYTVKHFARYVRPNAFSVSATCAADLDILPLAFQHDKKKTLTVVLINQSSSSKTVKLAFSSTSGTTPTSFKVYQTNGSDNCADKGTLAANANLNIPANTLVTLVGEGSEPTVITSNEESQTVSYTLNAYVNENKNVVLNLPNSNFTNVELLDLTGKVVYSQGVANVLGDLELQTSNINKGLYILTAKGATIASTKVMID